MSETPTFSDNSLLSSTLCLRARNTHVAIRKHRPGYPETTTQQLYITLTDPQPEVTDPQPEVTDPQPDAQFFRSCSES